jgi:hypothetical protein
LPKIEPQRIAADHLRDETPVPTSANLLEGNNLFSGHTQQRRGRKSRALQKNHVLLDDGEQSKGRLSAAILSLEVSPQELEP